MVVAHNIAYGDCLISSTETCIKVFQNFLPSFSLMFLCKFYMIDTYH